MRILLTGGAGYIGSHTATALCAAGHEVVCFDNFSNSDVSVMGRLRSIVNKDVPLIVGDVRDREALLGVFGKFEIDAVVHFAALKSVEESARSPLKYYENNVGGSLNLIGVMSEFGVKRLIFSSSATVYGVPKYLPIDEDHPASAINPYGRTKLATEKVLQDVAASSPEWRVAVLRYFNPVGAHVSGLIGEDPCGEPSNLMPYISRVASGKLASLSVFGADYDTPDGTGIRDYIHVMDLAAGHVCALDAVFNTGRPISTWNIGTGEGYSVLDMIRTFERVNGVSVPFNIGRRRAGDVGACYASPSKANRELGWRAVHGLEEMCASAWKFESMCRTGMNFA